MKSFEISSRGLSTLNILNLYDSVFRDYIPKRLLSKIIEISLTGYLFSGKIFSLGSGLKLVRSNNLIIILSLHRLAQAF